MSKRKLNGLYNTYQALDEKQNHIIEKVVEIFQEEHGLDEEEAKDYAIDFLESENIILR